MQQGRGHASLDAIDVHFDPLTVAEALVLQAATPATWSAVEQSIALGK